MSIGVYVVDSSSTGEQSTCRAVLGYRNLLSASIASGTGRNNEDTDYPLELALDDSYFTEYSINIVSRPTTAQLVFSLAGVEQIDYFMLISKNAEESGLSVIVEAYRTDIGAYEQVAGFGSMTNGKPVMIYFGQDYDDGYVSAISIRITFTYTSKPYIMSMMCGKAIVFPRTFSLGFQPPSLASLDEVRQFEADEGLNLVRGIRRARGNQAKGSINFVRMTTVKEFWPEFMGHVLDSKPLCLMWNDQEPTEIIYGVQDPEKLTKPTYKTSLFTQLDFDIVGWA